MYRGVKLLRGDAVFVFEGAEKVRVIGKSAFDGNLGDGVALFDKLF